MFITNSTKFFQKVFTAFAKVKLSTDSIFCGHYILFNYSRSEIHKLKALVMKKKKDSGFDLFSQTKRGILFSNLDSF